MAPPPDPHSAAGGQTRPKPFVERRRPGRIETVSPELIPLLRGQTKVQDQPDLPAARAGLGAGEVAVWIAIVVTGIPWVLLALGGWSWLFEPARPAAPVSVHADQAGTAGRGKGPPAEMPY